MARKNKIQNKPSAFQQKYSASPLNACWAEFKRKPGTALGAKGSCEKI